MYYTTGRAKGWHTVPDEILEWVTTALRESQADRKQFHDEAMANLQREHRRLQDRIDAMYLDKLDGAEAAGFMGT